MIQDMPNLRTVSDRMRFLSICSAIAREEVAAPELSEVEALETDHHVSTCGRTTRARSPRARVRPAAPVAPTADAPPPPARSARRAVAS
jgi:hypothetical protein